ncbi:hypothetical protein PRIPAC_90235 [Pristionchus pacificus]|uniref:Saposin B-type domain-containing protein n=1 Tax=Pristionchus pacificus TaxID=54126 RepID=A0A454XM75_PRIPA|nr:hypothetical protein PRIPAC_90235 [Pristionchus pacificus]|eukprot:PDM61828.1 hypothetical protein PRIPAC_51270 [Pristionchus pacificus]
MRLFLALLPLLCFATTHADICFDCVVIVEFVENLLLNREDDLEGKLDAKCHEQFPQDWADAVCDSIVKTKLDQIVKGIENDFPPDQICDQIGLCNLVEFLKTLGIVVPADRPAVNLPVA